VPSRHARDAVTLLVAWYLQVMLPNMVVAIITRNSIGAAFDKGIGAAVIHDFLAQHLHRGIVGAGTDVPKNVVDQLYYWEVCVCWCVCVCV
jgi:hypothetical protein